MWLEYVLCLYFTCIGQKRPCLLLPLSLLLPPKLSLHSLPLTTTGEAAPHRTGGEQQRVPDVEALRRGLQGTDRISAARAEARIGFEWIKCASTQER